jgi:hypothetical protein
VVYVKAFDSWPDCPPWLVTCTTTDPAECVGVLHVIVVALVTDTLVAAVPPKVTLAPALKFVPDTVTWVPPAAGPDPGLTAPTVGAAERTRTVTVAVTVPPGPVAVNV